MLVYVGVGCNEGERFVNLIRGIRFIAKRYVILAVSSIYRTKAVGFKGRDFLNAVILLRTYDNPFAVLSYLKTVEHLLGRRSNDPNRPFDGDILLWENLYLESPILTVPHPRMYLRAFVQIPLMELFKRGFPTFGYKLRTFADVGDVVKVVDGAALQLLAVD
ncbi:MAG: 2-amino-4-hydroxy-6-hydroxymethyldihydropteridine diphosphokinase [Thermotogae bacterium]|nr:2-amino-4-hydroxy-6-hydroxymethyldihydropteridine diphosphokinase [Thermotogota bacterium]